MNVESLTAQIARLRHGDHVCAFYNDFADELSILIPWVQEALVRGERCIYVTDERTAEGVTEALVQSGIDVEKESRLENLRFLTKSQWRHGDSFDRGSMSEHVKRVVDHARGIGVEGLWIAVEMTWTRDPDIGSDAVARWEGMWNDLLIGMPVVLLCQYDRRSFAPDFLRPELHSHPFVIHDGRLYPSCYYDGTLGSYLEHNSAEGLDQMLAHIRSRAMDAQPLKPM